MTRKYTSRDDDTRDEFQEEQDDTFYDVSFDLPIDEDTERHSSPSDESDLVDSTKKDKPSKWDGFYDEFREKQDATFEQAKQEQVEISESQRQASQNDSASMGRPLPTDDKFTEGETLQDNAAKSSIMLDRSIRKVKSLFADFDNYEPPVSNPYKAEVHETLKQRSAQFSKKETPESLSTDVTSGAFSTNDSNESSPKWFNRFRQSTSKTTEYDDVRLDDNVLNQTESNEFRSDEDEMISQTQQDSKIPNEENTTDVVSTSEQALKSTRNVTGVNLFKKLFKAPSETETIFSGDDPNGDDENASTLLSSNTEMSLDKETKGITSGVQVNETELEKANVTEEIPDASLLKASNDAEQGTSRLKKRNPFYRESKASDSVLESSEDLVESSIEPPTSKSEEKVVRQSESPVWSKDNIVTEKEVETTQNSQKNKLNLDKDYFDSVDTSIQNEQLPSDKGQSSRTVFSQADQAQMSGVSSPMKQDEHKSTRRYSSDLPSPEEIRKERERRRRLRVQELEQMTSSDEVEETYKQSYSKWLKDFNRKNGHKDTKTFDKDNDAVASEPLLGANNAIDNFEQTVSPIDDGAIQSLELEQSQQSVNSFGKSVDDSNKVDNSDKLLSHLDKLSFDTPLPVKRDDEHEILSDTSLDGESLDVMESHTDQQSSLEVLHEDSSDSDIWMDTPLDITPITTGELTTNEANALDNIYLSDEETSLSLSHQSASDKDWSKTLDAPIEQETRANTDILLDEDFSSSSDDDETDTFLTQDSESEATTMDESSQSLASVTATDLTLPATSVVLASQAMNDSQDGAILDLTEATVTAEESQGTHFTLIHDPVDVNEIDDQLAADVEKSLLSESIPIYKRKDKNTKKEMYSLAALTTKEKIFFALNITFNVVKRISLYIVLIGILVGAMAGGVGFGYFANLVSKTPPPSQEEMASAINRLEQQSTLYYASGEPIANIRADVVRTITNIDEISPYIIDGLIATEDEDFYNHPGVMPKAIFRAALESVLTEDGSGGSTLTQQLVKQQLLSPDVTFFRKANEILLALRLENYFTKDQILMAYLNVSPFGRNNNGDNVAGIMKASEGIFGVKPKEVTLNQAAFLVGLPQDPYNYTPYDQLGALVDDFGAGINRMHEVLYRMYREEKITKEQYDAAIAYDITQDFLPQETRDEQRQSYLYQAMMNGAIEQIMLLNIREDGYDWKTVYEDVDWYNEYYFAAEEQLRTGGYKVYTTIDKDIYDHLQVSAAAYDDQLGATYDGIFTDPETGAETYYIESVQKGIVVIDNKTGKVLGFVSGTDFENNQIDHAFNMRRSPGSTIKPLAVYGPAIEENLISPATIIPDTEFVQTLSDGSEYRPTNYGEVISGTYYSARTALMKSDNIPTVRIYDQLVNRKVPIIDYLEKMGFNTVDSYTETETQYLSFALGGVGTGPTVFEQTRAFSTFANNGQYIDGYYIERIEDTFGNVVFQQNEQPVQVFSEDTNYLMVDMLRDTMDGGSGQTAGGVKNFGGDWISKSGISENSKDIWFIGSTPAITIGSWIGYDNQYAQYVFDLNDGFDREAVRSQTYWGNIVNDLYAFRPDIFGIDQSFSQPDSVQSQTVLQTTGTLPGSVQINNRTYQVTSPTYEDLFKTSNPAPALSFNFMFNATDSDHQTFWAQYAQNADQQRQQQQQQQSSSSSSSSETDESSSDETTETPPEESTPEDSSNEAPPPAE